MCGINEDMWLCCTGFDSNAKISVVIAQVALDVEQIASCDLDKAMSDV